MTLASWQIRRYESAVFKHLSMAIMPLLCWYDSGDLAEHLHYISYSNNNPQIENIAPAIQPKAKGYLIVRGPAASTLLWWMGPAVHIRHARNK